MLSGNRLAKKCSSKGVNESKTNITFATKNKKYWWQMIQILPQSYNQRATVQLNYAVLRKMYHARKNHKLDEWSVGFMDWIKSLPYSELITGKEKTQCVQE